MQSSIYIWGFLSARNMRAPATQIITQWRRSREMGAKIAIRHHVPTSVLLYRSQIAYYPKFAVFFHEDPNYYAFSSRSVFAM